MAPYLSSRELSLLRHVKDFLPSGVNRGSLRNKAGTSRASATSYWSKKAENSTK